MSDAQETAPARKGLNFYAEDLMAPISKPTGRCERCNRKVWKGYFVEAPTGVAGVTDVQILCWRCASPHWLTWVRRRAGRP